MSNSPKNTFLNNNLQEINIILLDYLDFSRKRFATHPDDIDKALIKEDIELMRLEYDRASKMFAIGAASFGPMLAATLVLRQDLWFWFWIFCITTLINLIRERYRNRRMNLCYNTLRKKLQETSSQPIKSQKKK